MSKAYQKYLYYVDLVIQLPIHADREFISYSSLFLSAFICDNQRTYLLLLVEVYILSLLEVLVNFWSVIFNNPVGPFYVNVPDFICIVAPNKTASVVIHIKCFVS